LLARWFYQEEAVGGCGNVLPYVREKTPKSVITEISLKKGAGRVLYLYSVRIGIGIDIASYQDRTNLCC
jgi:hypothetical protein